ncbi:hypothetical protein KR009_011783 [Drosophila setifemur]|nr:hypothetical protein KR009_011783 [Drosophila setifemur]
MYECSHCNQKRSKLSLRPMDEKPSLGVDYTDGASSWCHDCNKLRFFVKCRGTDDPVQRQVATNSLEKSMSVDSVQTLQPDPAVHAVYSLRSDVQNQQAARLANHLHNWAVEAVDPPSSGPSFSKFPTHKPPLLRSLVDERPTPITPLNKPNTLSEHAAPRLEGQGLRTRPKRIKIPKATELKGINRLRAIPPKHLVAEIHERAAKHRSQPARNSIVLTSERSKMKPKSDAITRLMREVIKPLPTPRGKRRLNQAASRSLTNEEVKLLHHRYGPDESSGPETSSQANERHSSASQVRPTKRPTTSASLANERLIFRKLEEKRRQMKKLASMRTRIEKECEATKKEVAVLEIQKRRIKSRDQSRECGGAHFSLPRLGLDMELSFNELRAREFLQTCPLDALMKTLYEQDNSLFSKLKKGLKPKKPEDPDKSVPGPETEKEEQEREEQAEDVDELERDYTPLVDVLKNRFATPALAHFYMPDAHNPKDEFKRSQRLTTPTKTCIVVSSVQRASLAEAVPDPLKEVNRIKTMSRSGKGLVSPLACVKPKAHFTTVACAQNELLHILERKPEILEPQEPKELNVSRSPVHCPDADCKRLSFISDLNSHLLLDHRCLTMERIKMRQMKAFFLDPNLTQRNKPKCHMLYLVRDKIIDTQGEDLRDLLPVLVMTARTNLAQAIAPKGERTARALKRLKRSGDQEMFLIWLTSIVPRDMRLTGTLSIWSTLGSKVSDCITVHTSAIHDIRASKEMGSLCRNHSILMLPMSMIIKMSNNLSSLLVVQVQIY